MYKNKLLKASRLYFEAKLAKAEANLQNYLHNPVGIGEHPDLVEEINKLIQTASEAKEALDYINQELLNESKN